MSEMKDFKCPNCGGNIEFDSKTQNMKCPYCDSEFEIEALAAFDADLSKETGDDMEWKVSLGETWDEAETESMELYACKSCGGEIIANENTGMTSCPYCGNPVAMRGRFSGDLKPDYVLPFKLDKKAAIAALEEHFKGKKLLPKSFASDKHMEEIKGVYVPFWLFDADVDANFRYKATKERRWSDNNYNYLEKKFYAVYREGKVSFEKVPADGSSQMADDIMESLEPYDYKDLKPFTTAYLSGYLADKYDISRDDCIERANERIRKTAENDFYNTVTGFNVVDQEHSSIRFTKSSVSYALLPVWLLQTTWQGENYLFAMNGQTGKLVGNLPMDKGAYNKYFFIYWLIAFIICMIISMLIR